MNEQAAFLAAIADNPRDELGYLVFADWLQEQGEEARASLVRDPKSRALLGPTLADPFPQFRVNLLGSRDLTATKRDLLRFGERAAGLLAEILPDAPRRVLVTILECARTLGPVARPLLPTLMPLLNSADARVAGKAAAAVREMGLDDAQTAESMEPLIVAIRSEDAAVRKAALDTLGVARIDRLVFSRIERDRQSPDVRVRARALADLHAVGFAIRPQQLLAFLDDPEPEIRIDAFGAMNQSYMDAFVVPVAQRLQDTDPRVRFLAAECLSRGGYTRDCKDIVGPLRVALTDPDPKVVFRCIGVLGCVGPAASEAIDDILARIPHLDDTGVATAFLAVARIDPTHPGFCAARRERLADPDPLRAVVGWAGMYQPDSFDEDFIPDLLRIAGSEAVRAISDVPDAIVEFLSYQRVVSPEFFDYLRRNLRSGEGYRPPIVFAFCNLPRETVEVLPDLEAALLNRPVPDHLLGQAIARLRPGGTETLSRLLHRTDLSDAQLLEVLIGLSHPHPCPEGNLPRLHRLLIDRQSEPRSEIDLDGHLIRAIVAVGTPAAVLVPDLMRFTLYATIWETPEFPEALDAWLAAEPYDRPPYAMIVLHNSLTAFRSPASRSGHRMPHLLRIASVALRMHADHPEPGREHTDAIDLIRGVLRVGEKWAADAAALAPGLIELLGRPESTLTVGIVRDCVLILGSLADTSAVPALCPLLKHGDRYVAGRTAYALRLLGSPAAIGPLCEALSDARPVIRFKSVRALGAIGVASETVLDHLETLTRDDDETVRKEATRVRKRLMPRPKSTRSGRNPPDSPRRSPEPPA